MKKLLLSIVLLVVSCVSKTKQPNEMKATKKQEIEQDTTPRITGVGGIFFFSENPKETKEWYAKHLGLKTNDYGATFESRNANRPEEINYLQWTPFKKGSDYFAPSKKEFMVNYRVQNIEGLVRQLKANGVTVVDNIETYDYGKFVHIFRSRRQ